MKKILLGLFAVLSVSLSSACSSVISLEYFIDTVNAEDASFSIEATRENSSNVIEAVIYEGDVNAKFIADGDIIDTYYTVKNDTIYAGAIIELENGGINYSSFIDSFYEGAFYDGVSIFYRCGFEESDFTLVEGNTYSFYDEDGKLTLGNNSATLEYNGFVHTYDFSETNEFDSKLTLMNDTLYLTSDENSYVIGYYGNATTLTIESSIDNTPVVAVGTYAFFRNTTLESVTIPVSVKEIQESAFSYCTSLTSVYVPNSVTTMGETPFYCSYNVTMYTSFTEKQTGWDDSWDYVGEYNVLNVVWGHSS